MTNIFGSLSQAVADMKFAGDMYGAIGKADLNSNVLEVANALNQVPLEQLSAQERSSLVHISNQLAGDGVMSGADANSIVHLIQTFGEQGTPAFDTAWPFPDINLGNMAGNPLYNGLSGVLSNLLGGSLQDMAFQGTVDGLLANADQNSWTGALDGAFNNADMSALNGQERSELISMLSVAVADGSVNWPEAQVILDKLNEAQGLEPAPAPTPDKEWTVEQNGPKATIDLGTHRLEIDERRSEMWIINKETGDKSRIWGDPHFDMDGDGTTDVDFWGTISLNLEGGTKITIQTTPWKGNEDMTVSSRLVITNGDKSIEVNGMDQNHIGDMTIEQTNNGRMMDVFTGDGLDVYENPNGEGWLIQDGMQMREITQTDMNATKHDGGDFSIQEALQAMMAAVASGTLMGQLVSMFGNDLD